MASIVALLPIPPSLPNSAMNSARFALPLLLCLLATAPLRAGLSLPQFFSEGMVLQRDREAAIWGRASEGAEVNLSFKGATATVRADGEGRWRTTIATGPADAAGAVLTVSSGEEKVEIRDVLVGEVWFASGQSNMVYTVERSPAYAEIVAATSLPSLRYCDAAQVTAVEPQEDIPASWTRASPETVGGWSAVAFFFARKIHEELGVPVGVIKSAWGGKPVETFTSREALSTLPGTKALVDACLAEDKVYDPAKARAAYGTRLAAWNEAARAWRAKPEDQRGRLPRKPVAPKRPLDTEGRPGVLYNAMIHPFVGYAMRGAIWYQGEGNAKPGAVPYDQTLPLLIRDWRDRWGDEFSFYFVQLANFRAPTEEPGSTDPWPLLQDRMRRILTSVPKTGMAVINDTGEAKDIHPKNKKDPGERLALWALAKNYGHDLVHSGPLYASHERVGGGIRVVFDHVGEGLLTRDGEAPARFEIAGEDRAWHWADARIDTKSSVLASSPEVPDPVAVRYAWAANPEGANLVNSAGLPASVFRTDDWDDVEAPAPDTAGAEALKERRALGVKVRELAAQRDELERGSEAWRQVSDEIRALQEKIQASEK